MAFRSVTRRILTTKAGPLQRLVGTTDFKGQGTKHELADVDPVVLTDIGVINGKGLPPFGLHPHYGLIAVTTIIKGSFRDADNLGGQAGLSDHFTEALDIYAASAGKGVCHEEYSSCEGEHVAVQTIFKIPDALLDHPPELAHVKKEKIPVISIDGGQLRLNIGKLGDKESPATLPTFPRAVMLRVFVDLGKTMNIPLDEDLEHGFVIVLDGECKVGVEKEELKNGGGCLLFGEGNNLTLDNTKGDKICDALVVAGKPLNEPWVKLLGRNGFIIAKDEEEANRVMDVIHKEGNEFTYKNLQ